MIFDFYGASVEADPSELLAGLVRRFDLSSVRTARGMHGFNRGAEVHRGERVLARVWWEGTGPDPHVQGSGESAPTVADYLRGLECSHYVARADVREDYTAPGAFDLLSGLCLTVADAHRIKVIHQGDWHRAKDGRTVYLGAPTSPIRLRCYEKGLQVGGDPDHVRVELQVRPRKEGRSMCARAQPAELFGSSRWSRELGDRLGMPEVQRLRVGTTWRAPDEQRARAVLVRQYGRVLKAWAEEIGSFSGLGVKLGELVIKGGFGDGPDAAMVPADQSSPAAVALRVAPNGDAAS